MLGCLSVRLIGVLSVVCTSQGNSNLQKHLAALKFTVYKFAEMR
jgi:hypothetical protein